MKYIGDRARMRLFSYMLRNGFGQNPALTLKHTNRIRKGASSVMWWSSVTHLRI